MRLPGLAHDIPPQAVEQAAFVLRHSYRYFPDGTVFCCVVDPGVGSGRPVVAATCGRYAFVAPAGPLLTDLWVCEPALRTFEITDRTLFLQTLSSTFHGRDVFAPVAARLASGLAIDALGPERPVRTLVAPPPAPTPGSGRVRMIDRFGNLVTDAVAPWPIDEIGAVEFGEHAITAYARTYAEAPTDGTPFFYVGSYGTIEVAIREANAARRLGVACGAPVRVRRRTEANDRPGASDQPIAAAQEATDQP